MVEGCGCWESKRDKCDFFSFNDIKQFYSRISNRIFLALIHLNCLLIYVF